MVHKKNMIQQKRSKSRYVTLPFNRKAPESFAIERLQQHFLGHIDHFHFMEVYMGHLMLKNETFLFNSRTHESLNLNRLILKKRFLLPILLHDRNNNGLSVVHWPSTPAERKDQNHCMDRILH